MSQLRMEMLIYLNVNICLNKCGPSTITVVTEHVYRHQETDLGWRLGHTSTLFLSNLKPVEPRHSLCSSAILHKGLKSVLNASNTKQVMQIELLTFF